MFWHDTVLCDRVYLLIFASDVGLWALGNLHARRATRPHGPILKIHLIQHAWKTRQLAVYLGTNATLIFRVKLSALSFAPCHSNNLVLAGSAAPRQFSLHITSSEMRSENIADAGKICLVSIDSDLDEEDTATLFMTNNTCTLLDH